MHSKQRTVATHQPCPMPNCGSSDAMAVYEDMDGKKNGYCFSCNQYVPMEGVVDKPVVMEKVVITGVTVGDILQVEPCEISSRQLSSDTTKFYGVRTYNGARYYPVCKKSKITGFKRRILPKQFGGNVGDTSGHVELFGQRLFAPGGQLLIITVGEEDAMSCYQMTKERSTHGRGYASVSLPMGANTGAFMHNLEYIDSFAKVVFCVDQDEKDQELVGQLAELLSVGKAYNMTFEEKDASDMLVKGLQDEWFSALARAKDLNPSCVIEGKNTWDLWANRKPVKSIPLPEIYGLNDMTYGIRLTELDVITSGTGMGKSTFAKEILFHLLHTTKDNLGLIALEETTDNTVGEFISMELQKRVYLPGVESTIEEQKDAWDKTLGTNRLFLEESFGSLKENKLCGRIRLMVKQYGCKYIVVDHLHIAISELAAEGDERKRIDSLMTKLKNLTIELGIWIGLVAHLRNTTAGSDSFERGGMPQLDDLRGSGAIKQLANTVYALTRNQQSENKVSRNTLTIYVLKCRFSGKTGRAADVYYNETTGRMEKLEPAI